MTVMVGVSAAGHKFKPVVVGRSKRPRCFRNVDMTELPVVYYSQPSAWMTAEIFESYVVDHLIPEIHTTYPREKVILTPDNTTCHPEGMGWYDPDIVVDFLPPNTTSLIQPCDQSVIYSLKCLVKKIYYYKLLTHVRKYFANADVADPYLHFLKSYTMHDAVNDLGLAWKHVHPSIIRRSFHKLIDIEKLRQDRPPSETSGSVDIVPAEGDSFTVSTLGETVSIPNPRYDASND